MLRNLFCIFVAGAWVTVLFPFACLVMLLTLSAEPSFWMVRNLWAPVLLWAGGARLVVIGREHVDPRRPTLYISNHQSTIDVPCLSRALRANVRYVAKHQLKYVPVMGWYMWLTGFPFVDRGNRRSAVASLEKAGLRIRKGLSIVVYPEGTRSDDGRVLPFKKGPFMLALKAQVAICPVAIEGSGKLMPKNSWHITPGEIRVKVGAPIDVTGYTESDRERLMQDVRSQIIDLHRSIGGLGGDKDDAVAAAGLEGVGRGAAPGPPSRSGEGSALA